MRKFGYHSRRILVGFAGGLVTLVGLVLVPYPGPGWLIVFAGLAILATEFKFAKRILDQLRARYDQWQEWIKQQTRPVQVAVLAVTGIVVVFTVWLVNGFGLIDNFLQLHQEWLVSPFFR